VKGCGTFGLIDTGQKKLLVTCWHVIFGPGGFQEVHSENPAYRFAVGIGGRFPASLSFEDLMKIKVDEDRRCDLVTFNVGDDEALGLIAMSNLQFFNLKANRPPKLKVGDVLYLIGYPGKGKVENENSIGHPRQPFGVQAVHVGESTFQARGIEGLNETDYGGISGAPCFVVSETTPIRLVGFATGFAPNEINLIQFTYARYIGEDGIIRYMN
jgi:hypothetical protein